MLAFLVYLPTLFNGFVYDDTSVIIENPWIKDAGSIKDIFLTSAWSFKDAGEASTNYYRPMLHLFLMGGYHIFGLSATGFHMVNLIVHCLNTVLVFLIAAFVLSGVPASAVADDKSTSGFGERKVFRAAHASGVSILWPFLAALIFMLHPVNSEPVNWLSSLSDLQFALFTLASFYLYVRSRISWRDPCFLASLALFFAALLSKETAMALIPMIVLYGYFFRTQGAPPYTGVGRFTRYIPFILIALFYLVMRSYSFSFIAIEKKLDLTLYESMLAALPLLSAYFGKLLFPLSLNALYPYHHISSVLDIRVVLSILVLFGFFLLLILTWKSRVIPFLLFWIVVPLLPVLYIPVLTAAPFAERYLYLSTAGFAILYSYSLRSLFYRYGKTGTGGERTIIAVTLLIFTSVVLLFYLIKVESRIYVWRSDLALWSDTVKKSPQSSTAHFNLGWAYQRDHDNNKAVKSYHESIRLGPTAVDAHYNLGQIYMKEGRYLEASKEFGIVMKIDPGYKLVKKFMERAKRR
ncbi:MAG: tetratricopeptide repeat protein [Thermodesulfobacteriota bacterium]